MTLHDINADDLNDYDVNGQLWMATYTNITAMTFEQNVGWVWLTANVMLFEQSVVYRNTWTSANVMVFKQNVKSKWTSTNVMTFRQDVEHV